MNDQQRAAMIRPRGKSEASHMIAAYKAMQMAIDALKKAERQLAYNDIAPHECYKEAIAALSEALNTRSSSTHSDAEYSEVAQPQDHICDTTKKVETPKLRRAGSFGD